MITSKASLLIACLGLILHSTAAKPSLGNVLLQVATSLSSSTPDDPLSHVSDFRAQPKANSRADRYQEESTEDGSNGAKNETSSEEMTTTTTTPSTTGTLWTGKGFQLFPWLSRNSTNDTEMYSNIIGSIIGSARERITVAFQRLLAPLQRYRQQEHKGTEFNETSAASEKLTNSLIKNESDKNDSTVLSSNEEMGRMTQGGGEDPEVFNNSSKTEMQSEISDPKSATNETAISLDTVYETKNDSNDQVENASQFVGLASPVEESSQPKVSFQLDNDYAFEANESIIGPIQPEKGFLAKRLEHISKQLNETRNQFRARTIQVLVPLVHLVAERRRGRQIIQPLETETTSEALENYGTAKNNEENNFPLPPHLSRLSNNLLALNPDGRAALVLQNAFNKYARLVINGRNASTGDRDSISNTSEQKEGNDNYSTDDATAGAGGVNIASDDDDDDENKDDIAPGSSSSSSRWDGAAGEEVIDNSVASRASHISASKRMNMQSVATVGILILEVFGSIAGLTWGAFNQLQLLFQ